jgi:hypothetical protein
LQQSTALLDAVVIIIGTAVYFALKFMLVGGPLVGKKYIFMAKQRRLL